MGNHKHKTGENDSSQSRTASADNNEIDDRSDKKRSSKKRKHHEAEQHDDNNHADATPSTPLPVRNGMTGGERVESLSSAVNTSDEMSKRKKEQKHKRKREEANDSGSKPEKKRKHKHSDKKRQKGETSDAATADAANDVNESEDTTVTSSSTSTPIANGVHHVQNSEQDNGIDADLHMLSTLKKAKPISTSSAVSNTSDGANQSAAAAHDSNNNHNSNVNVIRLFVGNLPFQATDADIYEQFDRRKTGSIVGQHWVTDKQTGFFYVRSTLHSSVSVLSIAAARH